MRLSAAERLWVEALLLRQRGRLRPALAACRKAAGLAPVNDAQSSLRADIEASLGLVFAAARHTPRSPLAAERLWQALFLRAAREQGFAPVSALCRAFLRKRRDPPPEPRVVTIPELDLAAAVGGLAGDPAFVAHPRFARYRSHPAVRLYKEASRRGMTAIGLQRWLLSRPPRSPLLDAMRAFARRARFDEYLGARRLADLGPEIDRRAYVRRFVEYTGLAPAARYELVLTPLHAPNGAARLNFIDHPGADGRRRIVSTVGPPFDYARMAWSIWHELGHALSDHWIEDHLEALDRSRAALTPASARRYGAWEQTVREHIVQGLATRMVEWSGAPGKPDGGGADRSLPYLRRVVSALEAYDSRRRRDFRSFYPRLIGLFEGLARGKRAGAVEGRTRRAQSDQP